MWSKNKEIQAIKKMLDEGVLTRERLLLSLFADDEGDLNLNNLDFSDFDEDVWITGLKVKKNLFQRTHEVGGSLFQDSHKVGKTLQQGFHKVGGGYHGTCINVWGEIYSNKPTKMFRKLKKISLQELKEMGYELDEKNGIKENEK